MTPHPNKCPWCQKGDSASRIERIAGKDALVPSDGDPCMCVECGQWSIWHADGLVKPDKEMARRIKDSPEAFKLKLGWRLWWLNKKSKRAPTLTDKQLLDIRNTVVDRARQTINDGLQLVYRHGEALELYMGVLLDMVTNASIVFGSQYRDQSGEECVAGILDALATALANMGIADTVEERLVSLKAAREEGE